MAIIGLRFEKPTGVQNFRLIYTKILTSLFKKMERNERKKRWPSRMKYIQGNS